MTRRLPKMTTSKVTIAVAIFDAYSEFQALRDEMAEWADNMDGANMSHLPKYDQVRESADSLDQFVDDEPDVPEHLKAVDVEATQYPSGKRGLGRSARRDNAVSLLQAVTGYFEDRDPNEDEQAMIDEIENAISEAESVEFPGMFG